MMLDMPRPRPPHLNRETTRHGATVWYVRVDKGPRTRIKADFGTEAFKTEYDAAVKGEPIAQPVSLSSAAHPNGTLGWLIARYRETSAWQGFSIATRKQRENIFEQMIATAGTKPLAKITKATITAGRDRRRDTPAQARNFLDAVRGLFAWAAEAEHVSADPTLGVKNPPRKTGDGFIAWTEEHVAKYRERWAIGTRQRVWLEVLLESGLRRGDAVVFGKQHIRTVTLPDGRAIKVAVIQTEKSGYTVPAIFPITAEFEAVMEAGPCSDLAFICGATRGPLTKESFGNDFREACTEAKVPGSAHGLRKLAAIRAAHRGATTAQLRALFAWVNDTMPGHYTKAADRQRLAIEAALIFANDQATSIPAPEGQVRATGGKDQ